LVSGVSDLLRPPGHGDPRPRERPFVDLSDDDLSWLDRAFLLGRQGWGRVHPNPMVGCVLVRGGRELAEGWHREFGGPHAEVDALDRTGGDAVGATAYVSLEPCRHRGKTAACTDALVRAGVKRVVYSVADPGGEAGGGGAALGAAGVQVDGPVWPMAVGRRENPMFFHRPATKGPFVAVKLAVSLDGHIAAAPGQRTQLTGPVALRTAHELRAGFDAVMVGSVTARVDDPRLTVREGRVIPRVPPARAVLDSKASLIEVSAFFREREGRFMVFVRDTAEEAELERLECAGAEVHRVPPARKGLHLGAVLDVASGTGIRSVLCEGGGQLASSLIAEGLARRLYLFQSPCVLGSAGVPAFPGPFPDGSWDRWLPAFDPERLGNDMLTVYERED
jgi:diaminohydroxyphosphoribosylaminopyrimidine deaminase/5-amino-6-(5-phosphoribosylamino)uracil reductase